MSPLGQEFSIDSSTASIQGLAQHLHEAFSDSGFAYLTNLPLPFSHDNVFDLSKQFFSLPQHEKMRTAKKTLNQVNENTYRCYFPTQPDLTQDNLKEGFEIVSGKVKTQASTGTKHIASATNLYEAAQWPSPSSNFPLSSRRELTQLYTELQTLSSQLLSLLAVSLNKPSSYFSFWLTDSLSTLRLLHYPPRPSKPSLAHSSTSSISSTTSGTTEVSTSSDAPHPQPSLSCTPHTDSGILTLLHQDPTGGLNFSTRLATGWIPAPYIPSTIVVNMGDLMAKVSGGRWIAMMHRVRSPVEITKGDGSAGQGVGRYSMPFFFKPGEDRVVKVLGEEGGETGEIVRYGEHDRGKMKGRI